MSQRLQLGLMRSCIVGTVSLPTERDQNVVIAEHILDTGKRTSSMAYARAFGKLKHTNAGKDEAMRIHAVYDKCHQELTPFHTTNFKLAVPLTRMAPA